MGDTAHPERANRMRANDDVGRTFLNVNPDHSYPVLRGLASPVRIKILRLVQKRGAINVNEIAAALDLPQSTVATHVKILEEAELIDTRVCKAVKGQQKICSARYREIVIRLDAEGVDTRDDHVDVSMPLGLYTSCDVSAPCGLCSLQGIVGVLDVPDLFLDPRRMGAALLWFGRGYVEYKFPNNAKVLKAGIDAIEFAMELSSEVPGTNENWPSDITVWVNGVEIGTWCSPGDFGDKRGAYTPHWWKLEGSQYGKLTRWRITDDGSYVDGERCSDVTLSDLKLTEHHSVRMRVGIAENAKHPGGINIFGRGFGDHDQDILMRVYLARKTPA
ncbi:helix-turn-helix domain-containing protein [Acuticoccus sp. M5D2P5]|uniref:ArsR/SmtB family transcription factor n=1 Tax=Acuticoccus kalidii TaxID=2910977 RepID=UPI001F21799A|nr:helix-turn-helix domain-containing protein [Acuticoccus kalidii]MCF3934890.1 helix-turn-helix domain-containing protein [Acuticoccus kalidii]